MSQERTFQAFISTCKKIESDKNYYPNITNDELLTLREQRGEKTTIAIQDSSIPAPAGGKIYQLKIAGKFWDDFLESSHLKVDSSTVILIDNTGQHSFHSAKEAQKGDFSSPLTHLKLEQFLEQDYNKQENKNTFNENNNSSYGPPVFAQLKAPEPESEDASKLPSIQMPPQPGS